MTVLQGTGGAKNPRNLKNVLPVTRLCFCDRRIRLGNLIGDSTSLVLEQKDVEPSHKSLKQLGSGEDVGKRAEKDQVSCRHYKHEFIM